MSKNSASPIVTVIIPCRDDTERLYECLRCIAAQDYSLDSIEVVVVDDGSKYPIEAPALQDLNIHVLRVDQAGSYAARNAALAIAKGEIFAFTDSDCLPEPGWISDGVKALEVKRGLVAGHIQVVPRNPEKPNAAEAYEMLLAFPQEEYVQSGFGVTANLFASREVYESIGGFDDSLKSGGDFEWCKRAGKAGFEISYSEKAVVRHPARQSYHSIKKKLVRTIAGLDALQRDNPEVKVSSLARFGRLCYLLLPPIKTIKRIIVSDLIRGFDLKMSTIWMTIKLRYAYAFESWRVFIGGKYRW